MTSPGTRTIRVRFDGAVDGLRRASRQAESDLARFRAQTDEVDRSLTRTFAGATKGVLQLGAVGNALPLVAAGLGSVATASGALLVLPAAALAGAAAVTVLKLATSGFGEAVTAADPAAFAEATKEMAPAAIDTAVALRALRPEFVALRKEVQDRFFAGFADDARALGATYLPVLRSGLGGIAQRYNEMGRYAATALLAPAAVNDVNRVLGATSLTLRDMRPVLGNVLAGVLAIGGEGSTEIVGFGQAVTDVSARFRDWARSAAESGRITELIREGKEELSDYGTVAGNVGGILSTIFTGLTRDTGDFSDNLVESTQAVEDFLDSFEGQQALQALGETLGVTADVARDVFLAALREFGPVITEVAPAVQEFARALGVLLVDAIETVGPVLQGLARFLSEHKDLVGGLVPVLGGLVLGFGALRVVQSVAGWVGAASSALGGLSFLISPLGLTLAAAAGATYLFAQRNGEAAEAARVHQSAVDGLKGTLDQYTGAVTEATVAETSKDIAARKLADGTTSFSAAMQGAGVSFKDYTAAAYGNEAALGRVNAQLFTAAARTPALQEMYAKWKPRLDEAGVSFETFTAAAIGNAGAFDELTGKLGVAGSGVEVWRQDLDQAVGSVGELGSALGEYTGVLAEAQEQTRQAAEAGASFTTVLDHVKAGLGGLKDGAAPLPPMVAAFTDLGTSASEAARSAGDAAAEFGGVAAGAAAAEQAMGESRAAFIAAATGAGLTAEQAGRLADQIGLIPAAARTQFETNATGVLAELKLLNAQFDAVPNAKSVIVNALTDDARARLDTLGFTIREIPNGQFEIIPDTAKALAALDEVTQPRTTDISAIPLIGAAEAALNETARARTSPTTAIPLVGAAESAINHMARPRGQTTTAEGKNVSQVGSAIDHAARNRSTTITVTYRAVGAIPGLGQVVRNAEGNLLLPMAVGGLLGTPQRMSARTGAIVPPRTPRLIGDNMTHPELFVPLDGSARSRQLFEAAAATQGLAVVPLAAGALLADRAYLAAAEALSRLPEWPAAAPAEAGDTYVTVLLDGEPIRATVRTELARSDREVRRTVTAGAGSSYR